MYHQEFQIRSCGAIKRYAGFIHGEDMTFRGLMSKQFWKWRSAFLQKFPSDTIFGLLLGTHSSRSRLMFYPVCAITVRNLCKATNRLHFMRYAISSKELKRILVAAQHLEVMSFNNWFIEVEDNYDFKDTLKNWAVQKITFSKCIFVSKSSDLTSKEAFNCFSSSLQEVPAVARTLIEIVWHD